MSRNIKNSIIFPICLVAFVLPYMLLENCSGILRTVTLLILTGVGISIFAKKMMPKEQLFVCSVYVVRLLVSIVFYQVGWKQTLLSGNALFGYDPARYYYQALLLIENGFTMAKGTINYAGIIYWYGILFKFFGENPIVPIIVNNLFSLISAITVYCIASDAIKTLENRKMARRLITGFCCIPELIWYDCMSSRETICMTLICIIAFVFNKMFLLEAKWKTSKILVLTISSALLGFIRTPFLIIIVLMFFAIIVFDKPNHNFFRKMGIVCILGVCFVFVVSNMQAIGSSGFDLSAVLSGTSSGRALAEEGYTWSTNSIGKLLVADTPLKLLVLAPIRMMVYIITPLPNVTIDFNGLVAGTFSAWQGLWVLLSSLYYAINLPSIFCVIFYIILTKKNGMPKIKLLIFEAGIVLFTVACGTQLIHERYRVAAIPWMFLAIVLGKYGSKMQHKLGQCTAIVVGICGIVAYSIIKFL